MGLIRAVTSQLNPPASETDATHPAGKIKLSSQPRESNVQFRYRQSPLPPPAQTSSQAMMSSEASCADSREWKHFTVKILLITFGEVSSSPSSCLTPCRLRSNWSPQLSVTPLIPPRARTHPFSHRHFIFRYLYEFHARRLARLRVLARACV